MLDKLVLKKEEKSGESSKQMLNNHNLANISPNPVDDYASVNLDLPSQSSVTIRIQSQFSLVETILSGQRLEVGKHSFPIDASKLGSGLYVCIIEIDGVRFARKFLKR